MSNVVTTRVFNLLDMPAGVVTVSLVKDSDLVPYDPGTQDPDVTRMAKRAVQDSLGLPVGVQVVTLPWREELCLRTMLELPGLTPGSDVCGRGYPSIILFSSSLLTCRNPMQPL